MARRRKKQTPARNSPRVAQPAAQAGQQTQTVVSYQSEAEEYTGPLPHPKHLDAYERIMPGAAQRIFDAFDQQRAHRQALEKTAVDANVASEKRGMWLGFVLAGAFLVAAVYLITQGFGVAGLAIIGGEMASLAGAFVWGRRAQRREREQKARLMQRTR